MKMMSGCVTVNRSFSTFPSPLRFRCTFSRTFSIPNNLCLLFTVSSVPRDLRSPLEFDALLLSFSVLRHECLLGFSENMDYGGGPCMFPLHRCKTIHLVRHGQGIHNVEGDKNYGAYMNPEYFDAHLTPLGWQQVDNLRKHVHASGLMKRIDLVIASPLLRTLQTAVGVFGGEGHTDRTDGPPPLMVSNAGNSSRAAISSLNCPPIVTVELCRERLGVHPCDKRRSISEYQFLFPAIDFSLIDSNEDTWWKADVRETKESLAARGLKFLNWLWTQKEKEIAIVTHRAFLFHTVNSFGNYSHPLVKKELSKHFGNCELRSMVIVDCLRALDASTAKDSGESPSGMDL
ncbi:hypothetical protein RJT34_13513 [Clitoria ternatea]|uniref:Phosphoglycerate mutase-like protein 1 n=1 Tax=Clitoria ternatea TaxID=43366 RepID=A0AAN9JQS9_CLITE